MIWLTVAFLKCEVRKNNLYLYGSSLKNLYGGGQCNYSKTLKLEKDNTYYLRFSYNQPANLTASASLMLKGTYVEPNAEPTAEPTVGATVEPTPVPTVQPTAASADNSGIGNVDSDF